MCTRSVYSNWTVRRNENGGVNAGLMGGDDNAGGVG